MAFFARAGVSKGERADCPQARVVALAECSIHAIFDAVMDTYSTSGIDSSRQLVARLMPDMLLAADGNFYGGHLLNQARTRDVDLLWRMKTNLKPKFVVGRGGAQRPCTERKDRRLRRHLSPYVLRGALRSDGLLINADVAELSRVRL
ncbi:MAG: hypothetical protein ACYCPT_07045 [Acidimicrobiales bacterium]